MNGAVASDSVEIVKILAGAACTMFLGYLAYLGNRIQKSQQAAAVEVKEVKQDLRTSAERGDKKMDLILSVADGKLGEQMRLAADALRVIANMTHDAGHIASADNAERDWRQHETNLAAAIAANQPPAAPAQPQPVVVVGVAEGVKEDVAAALLSRTAEKKGDGNVDGR